MKLARLTSTVFSALALCGSFAVAAQLPVPPLSGHIIDQTATLNAEQKGSLELTLQSFESKKGSQIALLIVPSTAPETIEQYSLRVAEQWKLGRKKIDDGAILVVAKNDRSLRIEVGYGLEGALNDAISKRIISETITPRFTQGDFFGGISAGVDQIIRVADGEALPAATPISGTKNTRLEQYAPALFILAMVLGGVMRAMLGRFPGALVTGGAVALIAWLFAGALSIALVAGVIALLVTLFSGGARGIGAFGGGSAGGGFGGGGFSGGGGSFGGGGASGRW